MINSINKLPENARSYYKNVYNVSYSRNGNELLANKVAWASTKSRMRLVNNEWVSHSFKSNFYTFDIDLTQDTFVTHSEDGNYYIEGVLTDTQVNSQGTRFTEEALIDFAKQINEDAIQGGLTHSEYQDLVSKYSHLPNEEFYRKAKTERLGILKTVRAIYDKGKLWIKAIIDKRYLKQVKKFNKMSIEAHVPSNYKSEGKFLGGKILGFALSNNPVNDRTSVAIV